MEHAITLDLSSTPKLKTRFPADTAAAAVFVSSLEDNEAFEPGTQETAVLLLTEQELAMGVIDGSGPANDGSASTTFVAHEITLPIEVFAEDILERDEDDSVYQLHEALSQFSMAGGKPIWLQGVDHDGEIILQFDDSLVDTNLGDGGRNHMMWTFHPLAVVFEVVAAVFVLKGDHQGFCGAHQTEDQDHGKWQPKQQMQPDRRLVANLDEERQPDDDRADQENDEGDRPVPAVLA